MMYTMPKHIGDHNKNQIISFLRENGHTSRIELSRQIGVSAPAVSRNIAKLIEVGIIEESGSNATSKGRRPVLLEICADYCYVIGADIVGGSIRVAIANLLGEIMCFHETQYQPDGPTMFEQLIHSLDALLAEGAALRDRVRMISLGAPGIFDPGAGKSKFTLVSDGWEDINLQRRITEQYGIATHVDNDVNMDVIGESWKGAGRNYDSILYLKMGQGIASRIVLQGKLLRGQYNAAGEVGFMQPCAGRSPSYEKLICNEALAQQYRSSSEGRLPLPRSLSDLLALRHAGDRVAQQVIDDMLEHLWVLLLNCVSVLDPEVIILGGEGGYLEPVDIAYIQRRIEAHQPLHRTILTSHLDRKSGIYGAIYSALDLVEDQIIATL